MGLHRNFPVQHLDQGFHFQIPLRHFVRISLSLLQFLLVFLGSDQGRAQYGSSCHAGAGSFLLSVIYPFGILAESSLYCDRCFDNHIIHPSSVGLQSSKLASNNIGTAGTGNNGGYPMFPGFLKTIVLRIDCVYGTQLGCYRIRHLIAVSSLEAHAVFPHANMAVRIHHSRHDPHPAGVNHLCALRTGQILPDIPDNFPVSQDIALIIAFSSHGQNLTVLNQQHCYYPLYLEISLINLT